MSSTENPPPPVTGDLGPRPDGASPPPERATESSSAQAPSPAAAAAADAGGAPAEGGGSANGGAERGEADGGDHEGGEHEGGETTGGEPGAEAAAGGEARPKGKRRRRRRKKSGAGQGAAPAGEAQAGEHAAEHAGEHAGEGEKPANAEGAAPAEGGQAQTRAQGGPGKKRRDGKGPKPKKGDKPRDKREAPQRERPAFGVGDVVFGKITEITDEAIFVDLSGKGRAIFDRAEMLLPDEGPEEAEPHEAEPHDEEPSAGALPDAAAHGAPPSAVETLPELPEGPSSESSPDVSAAAAGEGAAPEAGTSDEGAAVEKAPGAGDATAAAEAGAAAPQTEGEVVPPTVTSGGVERRPTSRRIIVAPGARAAAEPAPGTAASAAGEPVADAPAAAASATDAAAAGEETPHAAAETAHAAGETAHAAGEPGAPPPAEGSAPAEEKPEAPAAPKPAPYAPPIVLEVGAHFVGLVHNDGSRGGLFVLTRHPRRASRAKPIVSAACREKKTVKGLVTGVVKGGVEVDVDGLRAFAPGSHMDLRLGTDLSRFIGQRLEFAVTQYGKRGRDVVLSRKAQIEAEAKAHRSEALSKLTMGSIVEGTVKTVVSFGAFIDVGGVEGLVPLPEMSHKRSDTPQDVFKAGEAVAVKVLRVDEKGKLWLSRKAATADPRLEAIKKYGVGSKHTGKVVRLQPFGAFVELEPGIDGLIHTQDLSIKRIEQPSDVVKVGDSIDVVVASVDPSGQRIALHPALAGAAADEAPQKVALHKSVKVVVVAVESGGLVVRVLGATGRNARGFITSAATGTPRGTELRKPFPVGTQLEAKVIELDPRRGELKLSIKALREDTERSAYQQYRQQVNREAKFGTFGDLLAKKGLTGK